MTCRFRNAWCEPGRSCGECLWAIRNPHPKRRSATYKKEREDKQAMSKAQLKKSQTTHTSQPAAKHPLSPTLEDLYPNLFSYLTQDAWEDGSTRVTSTILFFVERG